MKKSTLVVISPNQKQFYNGATIVLHLKGDEMFSNSLTLILLLVTTYILLSKIFTTKEDSSLLTSIIISFSIVYQLEQKLVVVQALIVYSFFLLFLIIKLKTLNTDEQLARLSALTKQQMHFTILFLIINIIIFVLSSSFPTFSLAGFLFLTATLITSKVYKLILLKNQSNQSK